MKVNPEEFVDWFQEKFVQSLSTIGRNPTLPEGDQRLLAGFIGTYNIKSILEFGTHEGRTTLFFWLYPSIEKVKTIDWGKPYPKEKYGCYFKKLGIKQIVPEDKVKLEFCETINWKPKEDEYYDMIYIDAGHEYENVKNDSEIAFKMKPKIIVWHDYPNEKGVKKYIDEVKEEKNIKTFSRIAWMELING